MDPSRVRAHFDEEAVAYDARILRLVPQYLEQHELLLEVLPFDESAELRALDLGCGTGALSQVILAAFPRATLTSIDLSDGMLDVCRKRLARYAPRATFRRADFGSDDIGTGYDLVVSGLAIHHLDSAGTRALYAKIHAALRPGGRFLNRELVQGATPELTRVYEARWRAHVALSGEEDQDWFKKYVEEDKPVAVADHLQWLREAGFRDVACHWRRLNFAIVGGSRE